MHKRQELRHLCKIYPFKNISILIFIVLLLTGLLDERIPLSSRITRPTTEFILTYITFFIGFCSINNINELKYILNRLIRILLILCTYGIFTFILQNNPLYDIVSSSFSGSNVAGIWSNIQSRGYRVCSFLSNPIVYGGFSGMMFIIINSLYQNSKNNLLKYTLLLLILANVFIANSRTGIFSTLFGLIIFYFLKNKLSYKNFLLLFATIFCAIILYNTLDFIKPIFDSVIDLVITGGINTGGSNIELKETQWKTSILYFYDAPFFGNGFSYFHEIIGNKDSSSFNNDIAGMEGYQYKLLIENGLFMIIAVIIFYTRIIMFFYKNKSIFGYLGLSCTLLFLFFINSAGTYGSAFLHFGIYIGLILRCCYEKNILNTDTCIQCRTIH